MTRWALGVVGVCAGVVLVTSWAIVRRKSRTDDLRGVATAARGKPDWQLEWLLLFSVAATLVAGLAVALRRQTFAAPWGVAASHPDSRVVVVRSVHAECDRFAFIEVEESPDAVVIRVLFYSYRRGPLYRPPGGCSDVGLSRCDGVTVRAKLSARSVKGATLRRVHPCPGAARASAAVDRKSER